MAASSWVALTCDYPTCRRQFGPTRARTRGDARADASRARWVVRYGPSSCLYDLCPTHRREVPGGTFAEPGGRTAIDPYRNDPKHRPLVDE